MGFHSRFRTFTAFFSHQSLLLVLGRSFTGYFSSPHSVLDSPSSFPVAYHFCYLFQLFRVARCFRVFMYLSSLITLIHHLSSSASSVYYTFLIIALRFCLRSDNLFYLRFCALCFAHRSSSNLNCTPAVRP